MNLLLYDFYKALKMVRSSNLQFYYASSINCILKFQSKSKIGYTKRFLANIPDAIQTTTAGQGF